jgi:hypothetical protein
MSKYKKKYKELTKQYRDLFDEYLKLRDAYCYEAGKIKGVLIQHKADMDAKAGGENQCTK